MKITQFISTLGFGGAESVVRDYALELQKRGHQVTVIVLLPFLHNDNEKQLLENGIKLRSIYEEIYWLKNTYLPLRVIRKPFRKQKVHTWFKKYLNLTPQDVIHVHLELLSFIPVGICSKLGTKLFFTCHNEAEYYFGNKRGDYKYALNLLTKDSMRIFALHSKMKEELNKLFSIGSVEVMNNPVNVKRFQSASRTKKEMRKELGISETAYVIGHVGRFVEQKNHDFIIDVFSSIAEQKENAVLVLVGDGTLRKNIEEKCKKLNISDKVIFTGIRTDIPDVLSSFDVFFFPSLYEGLSVSLIEAQMKVPFSVTSDTVTKDSSVTNTVSFLSLKSPIENWKDALFNPEKYISEGFNDLTDFDLNNVISRLEEFYER